MSDDEYESGGEEEEEEEQQGLDNPEVVTKYKAASELLNKVFKEVADSVVVGAKVLDVCRAGDELLTKSCASVFNKKNNKGEKIEKGIAFPTCISVNSIVCHYSPGTGDETVLAEGDLVKIDMGVHIDGFIATMASTKHLQADMGAPVTGRAADVMQAAQTAGEAALRLMRPGKTTADVPPVLEQVAEAYGCNIVEGVLSHQMKRYVIDGNKVVCNKTTPEMKAESQPFEVNEVYAIDIVMSTGEGKTRVVDEKETTVYKRALDKNYNLKMKTSRAVFSEINQRFPAMPFTARDLEDVRGAKLGLVECLNHELLHAYPVLHASKDELVAHYKATVLLMPNGSDRITVAESQPVQSDKAIVDEELLALLASSVKNKKKKNKKKDKEADAA